MGWAAASTLPPSTEFQLQLCAGGMQHLIACSKTCFCSLITGGLLQSVVTHWVLLSQEDAQLWSYGCPSAGAFSLARFTRKQQTEQLGSMICINYPEMRPREDHGCSSKVFKYHCVFIYLFQPPLPAPTWDAPSTATVCGASADLGRGYCRFWMEMLKLIHMPRLGSTQSFQTGTRSQRGADVLH